MSGHLKCLQKFLSLILVLIQEKWGLPVNRACSLPEGDEEGSWKANK
jgi:hypothetical protein